VLFNAKTVKVRELHNSNNIKPLQSEGASTRKRSPFKIAGFLIASAFLGWLSYEFFDPRYISASSKDASPEIELGAFPVITPTIQWGFALDTFQLTAFKIRAGESLSEILSRHNVPGAGITALVQNTAGVFDFKTMRAGKTYHILGDRLSGIPQYLIYEPSAFEYVLFNLQDDRKVERIERTVDTRIENGHFVVTSTLWDAMIAQGHSYELADRLEDALMWSIDFYRIQKGDEFKIVFENKYVEDKSVGTGKVKGAIYKQGKTEVYAIYYENGEHKGYFDKEGRPLKSAFLKAPVRFSRVSSRFNLNRFHPVLKRRQAHLGTDYAAPHGTEIMSVGNGVVTQAGYTSGNGNFVRIRHDKIFETQYLHMSRFAKGIRPGVRVSQGQIIGYVGSTGLATGPHVCFRFWKNGQQVDHLRLNMPQAKPLPESEMPLFEITKNEVLAFLAEQPAEGSINP
jgi:murein DD-endopeptidase MepM/ murein hydrolase activator NlpD